MTRSRGRLVTNFWKWNCCQNDVLHRHVHSFLQFAPFTPVHFRGMSEFWLMEVCIYPVNCYPMSRRKNLHLSLGTATSKCWQWVVTHCQSIDFSLVWIKFCRIRVHYMLVKTFCCKHRIDVVSFWCELAYVFFESPIVKLICRRHYTENASPRCELGYVA